jgi:hypothetical protein
MTDSRVGKTSARRKKTPSKARKSRAANDRKDAATHRMLTDDERLDEFRKSFFQSVLPDLPTIKGYHVCWLTTTNPRDSIASRVRLGYEPIKSEDIPGWEHATMKGGEWPGCVCVNEMIAFKLPMSLYEAYMYEAHHAQPLSEEEKLTSVIDVIRQEAAAAAKSGAKGIKFELEEGMLELGQDLDPGSFAENLGEIPEGTQEF